MELYWHGEACEVFWMLYCKYGNVITVINVQDFDLPDYDEDKFVRNKNKMCHAFSTEDAAITFLNEKYEQDEIDPEFWRGGSKFLIRD